MPDRKRISNGKQNLTVQLPRETIRKAKVLAAQQGTSISQLVAQEIERKVTEEIAYEEARRKALAFLEKGFPLGGKIRSTREDWHDRKGIHRHKHPDLRP